MIPRLSKALNIAFRGLILHALVRVWGTTKGGLIQSLMFSALFCCSFYILDLISGRPLTAVLLQSIEAFFLGVFLGALVLQRKVNSEKTE